MSNPQLYGKLTDTYTSTTLPASMVAGQRFQNLQDGTEFMLVLANGTIAAAAAVKFDETANATTFKVIATAAATDAFLGGNYAGAQVTSGTYFWIQTRGLASILCAASLSAGDIVAPGGTAGTLDVGSAAAVQSLVGIVGPSAGSGAGGATSVYLY